MSVDKQTTDNIKFNERAKEILFTLNVKINNMVVTASQNTTKRTTIRQDTLQDWVTALTYLKSMLNQIKY